MCNEKLDLGDIRILKGDTQGLVDEVLLNNSNETFELNIPREALTSNAIIINFYVPKNISYVLINEAMSSIYEKALENADIIFDSTIVESMPYNKMVYSIRYLVSIKL